MFTRTSRLHWMPVSTAAVADDFPRPPSTRAVAQLTYLDEAGYHIVDMETDSMTIGRGATRGVDIRLESSTRVSRAHIRIRRDHSTGGFFLIDLSSRGTTVNGHRVPRGYYEIEGERWEDGVETALPDRALIGLADEIYLRFRVT